MRPKTFDFPDKFNASDKRGAGLLAECIKSYWAARGYAVKTERFQLYDGGPWGVSSNMVDGLPAALPLLVRQRRHLPRAH